MACGGGGGSSAPAATPAPTITIATDKVSVVLGTSIKLIWSSTDATSCSGSGAWSGVQATSGTSTQTPTAVGQVTYTITCAGTGGSANKSANLTVTTALTTTLTGNIYNRRSTFAYALNDAGDVPLNSAIVSVNSLSTTSTSNGSYILQVTPAGLTTDSISVAADTYIPISASRSLFSDISQINLGLYKSTTVNQRPNFVRGIFTMDVGGFMPDIFAQGLFEPTYDRIRNHVGANLVAISDPVWVENYDITKAIVTMSKTSSIPMLTRTQYTQLVSAAHSRNLAFMMQLGVYPSGSLQLPWNVDTSNTAFWNAWFSAYQSIAVEYAGIARDLNIEYISLGMNHDFMSKLPVAYWTTLITAIRQTGYQGKLVYQAGVGPNALTAEFDNFNMGWMGNSSEQTSRRLDFVKLFDMIVIDVHNVAMNRVTPLTISRDDIKGTFQWILGKVSNYPVPIMIQVGTPSVFGGAVATDYIEPCLACNPIAATKQIDVMQQADVYEALAEVINDTPNGAGNVMGILSWGYWFTDDYRNQVTSTGVTITNANAYDKSSNIRGKPAESVLRWWFSKF